MSTEPNSPHVVDEAVDYATGRLDVARAAEVDRHLERCEECAAYFAFVREIERDVLAAGARHLRPERLVALSEMPDAERTAAEREHLEACASCREELRWARAAPPLLSVESAMAAQAAEDAASLEARPRRADRATEPAAPPGWGERFRGAFRRPLVGWGALGLGLAAIALFLLLRPGDRTAGLAASLRIEALPTDQVTRGVAGPPEIRAAYAKAMAAYANRDYPEAAELFHQLTAIAPEDAAAFLYLGSAQLLRGRAADAVPALQKAASLAGSSRVGEESRWQLAEAYVLLRDLAAARQELQQVVALNSDLRADAEALLRRIGQ
jgi:tetratricopeptide (TPR) repeat protein